jgi:hypothetical protein
MKFPFLRISCPPHRNDPARSIPLSPNNGNQPLLKQADAYDAVLAKAQRRIAVERPAIEQRAGVSKVKTTLMERAEPLHLIPFKVHHGMYR